MDDIHYREYKILLNASQFPDPSAFERYWTIVCGIAKEHGVEVKTNEDGFHRYVREILFYDTKDYDLYRNAFILRKRTFYVDGWPQKDHELTVKFRHPDLAIATSVDMTPQLANPGDVKFKEEILTSKTVLGETRSLYSHNCVVTSPNIVLDHYLEDIVAVFPAMKRVEASPQTRIDLVNNTSVEEVQVNVGRFYFGHGFDAKATIAIWRDRASEKSLIGEFAFQAHFDRYDEIHHKAKLRSETFYKAVQTGAPEWVSLGTTKTAMVYGRGKTDVGHD